MRHVAQTFLEPTLRRGASLEQFLGAAVLDSERAVRWLELRPTSSGIELWDHLAPDLGLEGLDIYAFTSVEEKPVAIELSAQQGLELARSEYGANSSLWVNQGVAASEFEDYLLAGRQDHRIPAGA